jgi:hypothetical protein
MTDGSERVEAGCADRSSEEIPLEGGNTSPVVRVGNTVRRQVGPWTPSVHALLRHLESAGYEGAPRVLGIDGEGREILTFLPGQIGHYPGTEVVWSDDTLDRIARLLRRLHDLTSVLPAVIDTPWRRLFPDPARREVICHNDVAPYNTVFVTGRATALIDWDYAGPGPRIWDIAHAAYRFAPLTHPEARAAYPLPGGWSEESRLRRFCDGYGLADHSGLVETILDRVAAMTDTGPHVEHYRRDLIYLEERRRKLAEALEG